MGGNRQHQRVWESLTGMAIGNLVSMSTFMSWDDELTRRSMTGLSGESRGKSGIEKSPTELLNGPQCRVRSEDVITEVLRDGGIRALVK